MVRRLWCHVSVRLCGNGIAVYLYFILSYIMYDAYAASVL